eukprot:TRINITY_DN2586_c0_g1_i2.p1 TRINITY_DN2586_c0_g1~~TRINITY_DN2586_c0_g1_i2.p1  ORF type:complete len:721 (+),score=137.67 TRINITY_DN2586_c0_g1_i2:39-2201(+)
MRRCAIMFAKAPDRAREGISKAMRKPNHLQHRINRQDPGSAHARRNAFGRPVSTIQNDSKSEGTNFSQAKNAAFMTQWTKGELPSVDRVIRLPGAPAPHEVYAMLDDAGKVWSDEQVSQLMEGIMWYVTKDHKRGRDNLSVNYLKERALPLVRSIRRWGNKAIEHGMSRYGMLTILIVADSDLVKHDIADLLEQAGADQQLSEGAYRAIIRGYCLLGEVDKVQHWLSHMHHETLVKAVLIQGHVSSMYSLMGMFDELDAFYRNLYPDSLPVGHIPTETLLHLGECCTDNFEPERGFTYLAEYGERGGFAFSNEEKLTDTRVLWRCLMQLRSTDALSKGIDLLKILMLRQVRKGVRIDKNVFPAPSFGDVTLHSAYVSPYDALVKACLDSFDAPPEETDVTVQAAFDLLRRITDEIIFPHEPECGLQADLCSSVLGLVAAGAATGDINVTDAVLYCDSIVQHMQRFYVQPSFSTLLHLQTAVDLTWHHASLAGSVVGYIPNVDERLVYYLPGFRRYRFKRPVIGGARAVAQIVKNKRTVVIPHWEYFVAQPGGAATVVRETEREMRGLNEGLTVLPFSTLSSLQVAGDDMREQGFKDNPADASLRLLGEFLSPRDVKDVADNVSTPAHKHCAVLGFIEQRVCAALHLPQEVEARLDPMSEEHKLALLALTFASENVDLTVNVLCGSDRVLEQVRAVLHVIATAPGVQQSVIDRIKCLSGHS